MIILRLPARLDVRKSTARLSRLIEIIDRNRFDAATDVTRTEFVWTGKNRAAACCQRLSELNNYVPTRHYSGSLSDSYIQQFKVVVLTETSLDEQLRISQITRANDIALIIADTRGLFSQVFCDFGHTFTVVDTNGEPPVSAMVASISRDSEGVVTCLDDTRHGMEDGDYVTFSEVQGMTELNGCEPIKIKVLGPYTFSIGDTAR